LKIIIKKEEYLVLYLFIVLESVTATLSLNTDIKVYSIHVDKVPKSGTPA
jgi:hypothetical protein